ncbi:MAG TPA: cyclopropane fatty acyl phospholipid synthase [Rhodocyclaceae bacterium]
MRSMTTVNDSPLPATATSGSQAVPRALAALADAAGFRFNGTDPWDVRVLDARLYGRIHAAGSLGFGEAYVDGWWECERIDQLCQRLLAVDVDRHVDGRLRFHALGDFLRHTLFNLQSYRRAFEVGKRHYDIGNDVFEAMLDSSMTYSCAYWQRAATLEEAQRHKLDMICRKLELRRGERLLDIGVGWGGLARFAAQNYGVEVVGITVSAEQQKLARQRCAGLPVSIELMDYRDLDGEFDKVVSVGMFEHVGAKNYRRYFDTAARALKDDGLFLLHTIGSHVTVRGQDPWLEKYIFPNSQIPSAAEITEAAEGRFLVEDWHNFGPDYDRTLMAWWDNFERRWPELAPRYGNRFYRLWKYYLHGCAGYFRARRGQLWQVVFSKRERPAVYRSVR